MKITYVLDRSRRATVEIADEHQETDLEVDCLHHTPLAEAGLAALAAARTAGLVAPWRTAQILSIDGVPWGGLQAYLDANGIVIPE